MKQELERLGPEIKNEPYKISSERRDLQGLEKLTTVIESSQSKSTYSSVKALEHLDIPQSLINVTLVSSGPGLAASVEFDFRHLDYSEYGASGHNALIVNGLVKTLAERFEKSKIHYRAFLHRDRYLLPISWPLVYLVAFTTIRLMSLEGIWSSVTPHDLMSTLWQAFPASIFGTLMGGWLVIGSALRWLFPYFTYKDDKRNLERKTATAIIGAVVLGLIVNLAYALFSLLFSK
jgi:hypothetical protein